MEMETVTKEILAHGSESLSSSMQTLRDLKENGKIQIEAQRVCYSEIKHLKYQTTQTEARGPGPGGLLVDFIFHGPRLEKLNFCYMSVICKRSCRTSCLTRTSTLSLCP